MKTVQFPVTLYQDEDGWYVVECPIIPGCMSQGETEAEALRNIQEAIQLCLEVRREQGLPPTIERCPDQIRLDLHPLDSPP
jgi:predicted RNase H-like HicB family nuclease